jgi:hypothetical protein
MDLACLFLCSFTLSLSLFVQCTSCDTAE